MFPTGASSARQLLQPSLSLNQDVIKVRLLEALLLVITIVRLFIKRILQLN